MFLPALPGGLFDISRIYILPYIACIFKSLSGFFQNKRMNEYNGISATKIVQIYKHTFFKILLTG